MFWPGILFGLVLIFVGLCIFIFLVKSSSKQDAFVLENDTFKTFVKNPQTGPSRRYSEFVWPDIEAERQTLKPVGMVFALKTVPWRPSGIEARLIWGMTIRLDDLSTLQLDTGSANLLVNKSVETDDIQSNACQTLQYGGGSAYVCLGRVRVSDTSATSQSLLAEVVMHDKSEDGSTDPPDNILGLLPGSRDNRTSLVRQLDLTSWTISFSNREIRFSNAPTPPRLRHAAMVVPSQTTTTSVLPWTIVWHWSDGTTETWQQWWDAESNQARACIGQAQTSSSQAPGILVHLDTGSSTDLANVTSDFSGGNSNLQTQQRANAVCTHVSLTLKSYDERSLPSPGKDENASLLSRTSSLQQPHPSVTYTFKLSPELQQHGLTTIPGLDEHTPNQPQMRLLLGISSLARSYDEMSQEFSKQDKTPLCVSFM